MSQTNTPSMELLAPAGDEEALNAAISAGANAVYLGLRTLNARRGAKNFSVEELPRIVRLAHEKHVRVFLTLNIDVTQREIGQAVRMLKAAEDAGVDAVLVRDPAVIGLRKSFPKLEFHFSTQTCIANSEDVREAGEWGANRVVLARELSLAEIKACAQAGPVETEVFVQGALCFCVSGRCMLSSWAGGRSGNRGTCTSPCRVPWSADQSPLSSAMSMKDLTAVHRLADLQAAGVRSLKIEGRLKSARWVEQAVGLFAEGLKGGQPQALLERAIELGAYAGRQLTCGYLDADRDQLVAEAKGRAASTPQAPGDRPSTRDEDEDQTPSYDFTIDVTDKGIVCRCSIGGRDVTWTMPRTVVHRERRAITIQQTLKWLSQMPIRDHKLGKSSSNNPDFLMVPRATNTIPDEISSAIRQLTKPEDDTIRLDLPEDLRAVLAKPTRHVANDKRLGDAPDRVRLEARHVADFVRRVKAAGHLDATPSAIIVEMATADQVDRLVTAAAGVPLIIALPPVFFEGDIGAIRQLVLHAVAAGLSVEVNTWGGWRIARECGARVEIGPALGVMNSLAAKTLADRGAMSVAVSVELDRKQLEELTSGCPAPCGVVVFGRPALMTTRAKMDRDAVQGKVLRDRRGVELKARLEHGLWTLRPIAPFDLRDIRNNGVHAAHLVVDLVASPDPAGEWLRKGRPLEKPLRFNYGRTLA